MDGWMDGWMDDDDDDDDDDGDVLQTDHCFVKWSALNCSAWNLLNLARNLLI
jgi:hypothetical protein